MFDLLVVWIFSSLCLYVTAALVPGFVIKGFGSAMVAAVFVGLFNAVIRPILLFLTLPINILTLGLFTFVVNAIVLRLAAGLLKGFDINGWIPAIIGAIVLAIIQSLLFWLFGPAPVATTV